MKNIFFANLLLISISFFGQSIKNLKVYCTDNFNPNSSITVQPPNPDYLGITDLLKNNLVMNGFKVISESVAKERVELANKKQTSDTTVNQDISLGKTTYLKSVYVITFSYTSSYGSLLRLNGQIVDLANEGEIVATFSYNSRYAKTPSKVIPALCESLKEKQKSKQIALNDYNSCIDKNPSKASYYYDRALTKQFIYDYHGSLTDLNQAIKLSKLDNDDTEYQNAYAVETGYKSATEKYELDMQLLLLAMDRPERKIKDLHEEKIRSTKKRESD